MMVVARLETTGFLLFLTLASCSKSSARGHKTMTQGRKTEKEMKYFELYVNEHENTASRRTSFLKHARKINYSYQYILDWRM